MKLDSLKLQNWNWSSEDQKKWEESLKQFEDLSKIFHSEEWKIEKNKLTGQRSKEIEKRQIERQKQAELRAKENEKRGSPAKP